MHAKKTGDGEGFKGEARAQPLCLLGIIFLCFITCIDDSKKPPPDALVGHVWWGKVKEKSFYDEFAIEFTSGLKGVLHFLADGKKVAELPLKEIRFDYPKLTFKAGFFTMESMVDLEQGELDGKSMGSRGPKMELNAKRCDPTTIPGLLPMIGEYKYGQPPEKTDGLGVAVAQEAGLDPNKLEGIVKDIVKGEAGLIHSLLVVQKNRLVLEEYFYGYGMDDLHSIASCTKSITSMLLGLALDQGLIKGVDAPVLDYFPDYRAEATKGWSSVKLSHLLSMTAGLGWSQKELMQGMGPVFGGNGLKGFKSLLSRAPVHEPGAKWNYSSPDVNLLGRVISQATGMKADIFAEKHLFKPLGIQTYDWSRYGKKDGYPNLAGSLWLRPRDMAKIGVLILNRGRWNGKQLISQEWIQTSCTPQADTGDEKEGYGYLWWLMNLPKGKRIIQARGWGSQFILIDPELQRVIVITGGNETNNKTFSIIQVLMRHLSE